MAKPGAAESKTPAALKRASLALYRLVWSAMAAAAVAMPVLAAIRIASLQGPAPDSAASPVLPFAAEAWLLYALNLIPALFLAAAAVLLFWRRGREPVAMILHFSFLSSAASMPFVEPWLARGPFEEVRGLVEFSAPMTGLLGMMLFPDGRFVPRWMVGPALLLVPWTLARITYGFPLPLDAAMNDGLGLLVVAAILIRYHRLPPGTQRQQIRWAVLGMTAGLVLNTFAMILFAQMSVTHDEAARSWMLIWARTLLMLFYIFMPGGILISLLRYRLYDADAVITRSAAFAATTVLLGAIFAGSAEGIKWLIEDGLGQASGVISAAIAATLATLLVSPAHERLRDWAARRFQQALHHMRRDLPLCVADRRETAALPELLDEVLARLADGTRTERAAVLLHRAGARIAAVRGIEPGAVEAWLAARQPDPAVGQLDCDRDDPAFPLRIPLRTDHAAPELIGWILLGPRPDGSFYGHDEREALAEVADPIARAVRIVQLREARAAEENARAAKVARRIGAIERQMAKLAAALASARPAPAG